MDVRLLFFCLGKWSAPTAGKRKHRKSEFKKHLVIFRPKLLNAYFYMRGQN